MTEVATLPEPSRTLESYREDGVFLWRQALQPAVVDKIGVGVEKLFRSIADGGIARKDRFVTGNLPGEIRALYSQPAFIEMAGHLLQTDDVALYMNRILLKDRNWHADVAIHQDMPYFSGGQDKVSIFVPLTPTKARNGNGGLIFVKGSHLYGCLQRGTVCREKFAPMKELAPDLEVGDVIVMDFLTWHYSENATQPDERPLLQIAYQPATDGSYGGTSLGVPMPTLVKGSWRTKHFARWGDSVRPDV